MEGFYPLQKQTNSAKRCRRAALLLTAGCALAAINPLLAQAQSEPGQPDVQQGSVQSDADREIIVTANKRSEALSDVPMSITAVTGDKLVNLGITDVQGLIKLTPGLSYAESGNGVPVYSVRGIGFFETSIGARPTVSIYSDEAPLPFSIMAAGASLDLERVEVLKGPQGTLFGQNATAGAINYIAAKPRDRFEAGITGSIARFGAWDIQGFVSGPVSPNLKARVSARAAGGGAWQNNYTNGDELGDTRFYQGRILLDWTPTESTTVTAKLEGFLDRSDTQAGQAIAIRAQRPQNLKDVPLLATFPLAPANSRAAAWSDGEDLRRNNEFYQASLRIDQELSDAITLTSLTSYADMSVDQGLDLSGLSLKLGNDGASRSDTLGSISAFSTELRLSGRMGSFAWVVGGNYSLDKSSQSDERRIGYGTPRFLPFGQFSNNFIEGDQRYKTWAGFANADVDLTDTITAHAGARYTKTDLGFSGCSRPANAETAATVTALFNAQRAARNLPPLSSPLQVGDCLSVDATITPALLQGNLKEDNVSWRVGLDWKPAPKTLIYANISRGYKTGSFPVLPALSGDQLFPITQESVLAYEVGFKASVAQGLADVSGAAFYYDYSDKQLKGRSVFSPNIFGALETLVNIPKSSVKGVELAVNAYPTTGLTLGASGTYIDTKVIGNFNNFDIIGQPINLAGEAFPYTPKWQLMFNGQYDWQFNSGLDGFVIANVRYNSSTVGGFGGDPLLKIDPYTIVDGQIGVESQDKKWRVALFGDNIFNKYYWNNVAKINDTVRRLAGKPRIFGIRASMRFGN